MRDNNNTSKAILGFTYDSTEKRRPFQRGARISGHLVINLQAARSLIINHGADLQYVLSVWRWLRRGTARGEEAEQRSCIDWFYY